MQKDYDLGNSGESLPVRRDAGSFCRMKLETLQLNFDHHGYLICHETPADHPVLHLELYLNHHIINSGIRKKLKQNITKITHRNRLNPIDKAHLELPAVPPKNKPTQAIFLEVPKDVKLQK